MYNVQCLSGHVGQAPRGSDLEKRCLERERQGKLDALCLTPEECPECQEEYREQRRIEARLCGDVGCPMGEGDCKDGCLAMR